MADQGDGRRSKRARRAVEVAPDARSSSERASGSTACRPTPAEEQEALDVIRVMKTRVPPILAKRAPAKPNVVACAIAMSRGERFESDAQALDIFGVAPRTDVRELWESSAARCDLPRALAG